jgi:flagellar hook-basal body complex protein FliE
MMDIKATASHSDINAVLQQMRQIRAQTQNDAVIKPMELDVSRPTATGQTSRADFGGALKQAIDTVNDLQKTSSAITNDFVNGKETNLVKVMVESQKASVGFQAMVQVRNRMVTAYQDIMNMPI